jgi:hypothetical protein
MPSLSSTLIPGAGMVQNIIEKMSDQIVAMVDEIMTEKADALVYEIIQPQIEEQMKSIFESYPVQMEASKMFNREIFPIYKQTLEDFANFNSLVKDANQDIDKAIEEYTKTVIENKDDNNKKTEAKQKLMASLKGVSDKKTGDMLTMKGGDLHAFLGNVDNRFKPFDEKQAINHMNAGTNLIRNAIEEIVGGIKTNRDEMKTSIEESSKNNSDFKGKRRKEMRIPKPKFDDLAKNALGDLGKTQKGGKSKRRKFRKQNKTYKKRR